MSDAVYDLCTLRLSLRNAAAMRAEARLLRDERPEISLDEEVRRRAERSILNMIAIK